MCPGFVGNLIPIGLLIYSFSLAHSIHFDYSDIINSLRTHHAPGIILSSEEIPMNTTKMPVLLTMTILCVLSVIQIFNIKHTLMWDQVCSPNNVQSMLCFQTPKFPLAGEPRYCLNSTPHFRHWKWIPRWTISKPPGWKHDISSQIAAPSS